MYRKNFSLSVLFALLCACSTIQGEHVYEMSLVNITYASLSNEDVQLNFTINQEGLMSIHAFVHKQSEDYYLQLIVAFEDDKGMFSNTFLNKTITVCKFLSTPSYEPLIQLYYKTLKKFDNNIPDGCPIGGDAYYFLKGVPMSALPVPPYIPSSNGFIQTNFMIQENQQFRRLATATTFINFRKL